MILFFFDFQFADLRGAVGNFFDVFSVGMNPNDKIVEELITDCVIVLKFGLFLV